MTALASGRPAVAGAGLSAMPHQLWRVKPATVLAVIAVGTVAVLALWWHSTDTITGFGDWMTNAGRITGLLAGYAIAVQLALMARVPAIERGVGADRLARWHALGGRYTVSLIVAHTLAIIWGYAVLDHENVAHQTGELIMSYPDVLMATVSLAVFVGVGVTSARAARKRLKYETWHFIHLYTYLAVGLMFAHQFATGAAFAGNTTDARLARWAWSAMYVLVLAAVVSFRFVLPLAQAARRKLRVAQVVPESADVVSVYLTGRDLGRMRIEPGQFFRWRFLTRELWWAANPYSLSVAPQPDWLRITVRVAGEHSAALRTLAPGTRVLAEGPYGGFTPALRQRQKVLLIAAGVGITPIRAMFEALPQYPGDVTLIYRANAETDFVLRAELDQIAAQTGARLHYLAGPPDSPAATWLRREHLPKLVPQLAEHDVFLCGPDGFTSATIAELRAAGVPRGQIHHESFTF